MIKSINHQLVALVGKDVIGVLRPTKVYQEIKREKISTASLVIDADVCREGVFGVTQEGKMCFLPI